MEPFSIFQRWKNVISIFNQQCDQNMNENATQTLVGKNEFLAFASATLEISI